MILPTKLASLGFGLADVDAADLEDYLRIKRICYEKYTMEYYGSWNEEMNRESFARVLGATCFKKILMNGKTVGFFAFREMEDEIGIISIEMLEESRNKGIGTFFLGLVTEMSRKTGKPASLKVFKSNPARDLYGRFGFNVCAKTESHYHMKYFAH